MSETHSLVRVRRIDYICDHCGEGRMVYTGAWWKIHKAGTHPADTQVFAHRCDVCGVQVTYTTTYPKTEYLQEENQ